MKSKALVMALALTATLFAGCGNKANDKNMTENKPSTEQNQDKNDGMNDGVNDETAKNDVVTSPSRVTDKATLDKAIKDSWIVILEKDVTTDKDVVLESGFKKDNEPTSRVLALYKTGENKEIVANYTLTTPKLIVLDENAKIEGGTIKGDVYVEANGVKLEGTKVDGNIYFKTEENKTSFHMDDKSSVTGKQEVKAQ